MSEWQSIEDAPMDGQSVLIWAPKEHWSAMMAHWVFRQQAWMDAQGNKYTPTHWMPLPDGPAP